MNALEFQTEITFCSAIDGGRVSCCRLQDGQVIDGISFLKNEWDTHCFWRPWGYIFKKSFLLDKPFVENRRHEDRDWIAQVLCGCNTLISSSTPMYRYQRNTYSTCNSRDYDLAFDHIACGIRFLKLGNSIKEKDFLLHQYFNEIGVEEIYKNIRIRNLSKYSPSDNIHYRENLRPLEKDLFFLCSTNGALYSKIRVYLSQPQLYQVTLVLSFPLIFCGRKIFALYRTLINISH